LEHPGAEKKAHRADTKAGKAEEKVYKERLRLVDHYKKCREDAGEDAVKDEQKPLEWLASGHFLHFLMQNNGSHLFFPQPQIQHFNRN
jgi:hypothetical protein